MITLSGAFLCKLPCITFKKQQARIEIKEYLWKPRSKQTKQDSHWIFLSFLENICPWSQNYLGCWISCHGLWRSLSRKNWIDTQTIQKTMQFVSWHWWMGSGNVLEFSFNFLNCLCFSSCCEEKNIPYHKNLLI